MTSLKDIKEQIIKIKTDITEIDIAERQQEQIIKIKTDITDIDIAESKIQLISLQLNPREKEGTNRTQEREKEPTEHKRERRNLLNSREKEKEPTKLKRGRAVRSPLKQCITADKPPYQRVSSESRQAHSHRIPSFPIAIP